MVGNNTPVFFLRSAQVPRSQQGGETRSSDQHAQRDQATGTSGRLLPEAFHQVTVVMSDRGIPKSYRHMHGFREPHLQFLQRSR